MTNEHADAKGQDGQGPIAAQTEDRRSRDEPPFSELRGKRLPPGASMRDRLEAYHVKDEATGCWVWTRYLSYGYGHVSDGQTGRQRAHRASYATFVGPIPDGMVIDHLCRNRACINPAHLEAVTHWENTLRGTHPNALNAKKTHCVRGHPLSGPNLTIYEVNGKLRRYCNACRRVTRLLRYMPKGTTWDEASKIFEERQKLAPDYKTLFAEAEASRVALLDERDRLIGALETGAWRLEYLARLFDTKPDTAPLSPSIREAAADLRSALSDQGEG